MKLSGGWIAPLLLALVAAHAGCREGEPEQDLSRTPEAIAASAEKANEARLDGITREYEHAAAVIDDFAELDEYLRLKRNLVIYRAERTRRG